MSRPDPNDIVHIVGRLQGLRERLGLNPRTLCGATLVSDSPGTETPDSPVCPDCAARSD
jgi:hypothetical protein